MRMLMRGEAPSVGRRVIWAVFAALLVATGISGRGAAQTASFNCATALDNIDKLVCSDQELEELHELLISKYEVATRALSGSQASALETSQRDWLKGRAKCHGPAIRQCLIERYGARLLVFDVQYGQGDATNPLAYRCDALDHEIRVSFVKTAPPAVGLFLGEPKDEPMTAVLQPSETGEKYVTATGLAFWASGEEASILWPGGKKANCHLK